MRHDKRNTLYLNGIFEIFKKRGITLKDITFTVRTKLRACLLLFHLIVGKIPGSDTFFLPLEYWTMDHVQEPSDTVSVCNVSLVGTLRTDLPERYLT